MTKYHINDDKESKICTAKEGGCLFQHFDNKEAAEQASATLLSKEYGTIPAKKTKQESIDQRIYTLYKKNRELARKGNQDSSEMRAGSYFNHSVKFVAKIMTMSMDEARNSIYRAHAKEHNISWLEAKENFDENKEQRAQDHQLNKKISKAISLEAYQKENGIIDSIQKFNTFQTWKQEKYKEMTK